MPWRIYGRTTVPQELGLEVLKLAEFGICERRAGLSVGRIRDHVVVMRAKVWSAQSKQRRDHC